MTENIIVKMELLALEDLMWHRLSKSVHWCNLWVRDHKGPNRDNKRNHILQTRYLLIPPIWWDQNPIFWCSSNFQVSSKSAKYFLTRGRVQDLLTLLLCNTSRTSCDAGIGPSWLITMAVVYRLESCCCILCLDTMMLQVSMLHIWVIIKISKTKRPDMQTSIIQCLSQARINWEGCSRKGIWRINKGMMELGAWSTESPDGAASRGIAVKPLLSFPAP